MESEQVVPKVARHRILECCAQAPCMFTAQGKGMTNDQARMTNDPETCGRGRP